MIQLWHIWTIIGLVLLILELFTPGFIVSMFGAACLIVAPFAAAGTSLNAQLLIFGAVAAVLALGLRPILLKLIVRHSDGIKTNMDAVIGQTGVVVEAVEPPGKPGRVQVAGEQWRAQSADSYPLLPGDKVMVRRLQGCTVIVERIR